MGHPAQIVIIEDGRHLVVYDKSGGWPGLEYRVLLDRSWFTMENWADRCDGRWHPCPDAVYLVDHDRKALLLSFLHLYDFPDEHAYRVLLLRLLRHAWKGWQVDWAYNGVEDAAAYIAADMSVLGEPRLSDPDFEGRLRYTKRPRPSVKLPRLSPRRAGDRNYCLVTVEDGADVRAYGVTPAGDEILRAGPTVLDRLPEAARLTGCDGVPLAGLHVDLTARTGGYWTRGSIQGPFHEVHWTWPGWKWDFWEDDYAVQRARAGGAVTIPDPDEDAAMADLVTVWAGRLGWDLGLARELLAEALARPPEERTAAFADLVLLLSIPPE